VTAEDAFTNHRGHRKPVKTIRESSPQTNRMPPLNLIVKSVNPIDAGTLVIAAEQEEIQWVLDTDF